MNRREFLCGVGCSAVAALCGCVAPQTREETGARMPPGESREFRAEFRGHLIYLPEPRLQLRKVLREVGEGF